MTVTGVVVNRMKSFCTTFFVSAQEGVEPRFERMGNPYFCWRVPVTRE